MSADEKQLLNETETIDESQETIAESVVADNPAAVLSPVSGLYEADGMFGFPLKISSREELRLDVDGTYPQMTASGLVCWGLTGRVHWIAKLAAAGTDIFTGPIWHKEGGFPSLPYTSVRIQVRRNANPSQRTATVTF